MEPRFRVVLLNDKEEERGTIPCATLTYAVDRAQWLSRDGTREARIQDLDLNGQWVLLASFIDGKEKEG